MYIIVGLGNPEPEYSNTRHNMGFDTINKIAKKHNIEFSKTNFKGIYGTGIIEGEKVILLKPQKYINLSGEVVQKFIEFFKIPLDHLLIICDDLDTPVGKIKLKKKGSSGGHNGLKNIEFHLHTNEYCRYKIGISNDKKLDGKDYVLGRFSKEEEKVLDDIFNQGVELLNDYFVLSFDNLMNKYNKK